MATSSRSARSSDKWKKAALPLRPSLVDVTFIGGNFGGSFKNGSWKLGEAFLQKYLKYTPGRIGLHLPNDEVWIGDYCSKSECITGLESLMKYFDVKPYHLVLFQYYGGSEFGVEIFNEYAVEIDYARTVTVVRNKTQGASHLAVSKPVDGSTLEYEKDRLCASFSYNAFNNWCDSYNLVLSEEHLEEAPMTEVIPFEAYEALGLKPNINWMEIGFQNFRWYLPLKWEDGILYFSEQWLLFAKKANLAVGDVLVFMKTGLPNKYDLALFEKENRRKLNQGGLKQVKGLLKWFKIVNTEIIIYGKLEIPRVFVEKYGDDLNQDVTLLVRDGMLYTCYYSIRTSGLYELKDFLAKYSVQKNYVLFFDYVGESRFYVSIYNDLGMEIFNDMREKLLLKTIMTKSVKSDDEDDEMEESDTEGHGVSIVVVNSDDEDMSEETMTYDTSDYSSANSIDEEVYSESNDGLHNFTVTLLRSHVDQNGHGVYLPRYFLPIYRKWKNSMVVHIIVGSLKWKVLVHRKHSICRFGLGWDLFTFQNNFKIGQKLRFSYNDNYQFLVTLAE